jgi:hypothetical protein
MDQANFPWRPLGALLVDDGLLTANDLERALAEQRETGRLLGEILVAQGLLTGVELAHALARQHGVELQAAGEGEADAQATASPGSGSRHERHWRPLGALLVDRGLVSEPDLREALDEKHEHQDRRLGEILISRGRLTPAALASALAEQHGVSLETPMEAAEVRGTVEGPIYQVFAPAEGGRTVLYESPNLLDAADFACEYVDQNEPDEVEIERLDETASETVWTYSRDRAEAEAASRKALLETFGFDPTRWGVGSGS